MKTIFKYILCMAAILLSACSNDNVSDLQLSGDCMVESIKLDDFEGTVNLTNRTITVRLFLRFTMLQL